ncbi:hypothetical protein Sste5344_008517 [Sporothrix stenoceras]
MDAAAAREQVAILRRPYPYPYTSADKAADQQERRAALRVLQTMCPALSDKTKYPRVSEDRHDWGGILHVHMVIEENDVAALRELIQVHPRLLTMECAAEFLCPPLVQAIKQGRPKM